MPPVVTHTPFLLLIPSPLPPCASPHRTTYYMHPTDALSATAGVIGMVDFTLDDPRVISIAEAAEHQRPHAVRIAHADQHVAGQEGEGVGALDLVQGLDHPVDHGGAARAGDQVDHRLGV